MERQFTESGNGSDFDSGVSKRTPFFAVWPSSHTPTLFLAESEPPDQPILKHPSIYSGPTPDTSRPSICLKLPPSLHSSVIRFLHTFSWLKILLSESCLSSRGGRQPMSTSNRSPLIMSTRKCSLVSNSRHNSSSINSSSANSSRNSNHRRAKIRVSRLVPLP